jgi:hypothetical protein
MSGRGKKLRIRLHWGAAGRGICRDQGKIEEKKGNCEAVGMGNHSEV